MTRSLFTGITGIRTHQHKLDVVANNLANMNTTGYKSQATVFSDLTYLGLKSASQPTPDHGGVNPQLIGAGVQLAETTRNFGQGTLESTGELLDFAIQGEGFFTLIDSANENVYTRDGSFGVDASGKLVDPATGFHVRRFGSTGESTDTELGFQIPGDDTINIPLGSSVPGDPTSELKFVGNLPATALPPTQQVVSTSSGFTETGGAVATSTTLLNDLSINSAAYQAGDLIELLGTNPDGSAFNASVPADTGTLGDVVTELNNTLVDATASLDTDGRLIITADNPGDSLLGLIMRDDLANAGGSAFSNNPVAETSAGSGGDNQQLSVEIFDSLGEGHRLDFSFSKTTLNSWDIEASITSDGGVLTDSTIASVTFNDDGTFALVGGSGNGDSDVEIQFSHLDAPQNIVIDLSELHHLAADFALTQHQDGFPPGTVSSVSVTSEGTLTASTTTGKRLKLAQLAIGNFDNNRALNARGGNFYQQSPNSGDPSIGLGGANGRGVVLSGQLEGSNVDIAQEFTQLIVAQRGFSANARTITVADQILEELTNIIR